MTSPDRDPLEGVIKILEDHENSLLSGASEFPITIFAKGSIDPRSNSTVEFAKDGVAGFEVRTGLLYRALRGRYGQTEGVGELIGELEQVKRLRGIRRFELEDRPFTLEFMPIGFECTWTLELGNQSRDLDMEGNL